MSQAPHPPSPAVAAASRYATLCRQEAPGSPARRDAARQRAQLQAGVPAAMDWAFECLSSFHFREGHEALAEALRRDPDFLAARWLQFQYPLDPSPANASEQQAFIQRWREGLAWFEALDFRQPEYARQLWGCIGSVTPFYLHYVDDAIPEMRRYGQLLTRMMATLTRGQPPRPLRSERRCIAVVSAHFREHTVARLFLPFFEKLERSRFDVHFIDLEPAGPEWQARLKAAGTHHAGPRAAPEWYRLLASLRPDIIIYPEIGMHPTHQGLAALRLAPVQACLWGHPVTTGLPTIDYALVPDAMEPPGAAAHYHEQLLRLPGLGHALQASPARTPGEAPDGLRRGASDSIEILCAQSMFKLLPAQDEVFARILRQLPGARLHLTPLLGEEHVAALRARMRPAFAREGVDIDERVVTHALMPLERFQALAAACDFGLDTLGWSGGMSALDLLPQGLPIIAVEGSTMRSRQTAALLRWLDLPELVVQDADDMVAVAVRLGKDAALRGNLRQQLRERASRLQASETTQEALADFLATVQAPDAGGPGCGKS